MALTFTVFIMFYWFCVQRVKQNSTRTNTRVSHVEFEDLKLTRGHRQSGHLWTSLVFPSLALVLPWSSPSPAVVPPGFLIGTYNINNYTIYIYIYIYICVYILLPCLKHI